MSYFSTSFQYRRAATGAVSRTFQSKADEQVSVKDFGAKGDGITDDLAAINAAITACDALGGGTVYFPAGLYLISDQLILGNGTNATQSTIHHKIMLRGANRGGFAGLLAGPTVIKYNGTTTSTKAVIDLNGPLYGMGLQDLDIDASSKAGYGVLTTHCDDFRYQNVVVRKYTNVGWYYTTRTGFPASAPYGCGNGSVYDCNAYDPANNTAHGIWLTSGVASATTLAGNPDCANIDFYGGVVYFGGALNSYGLYMDGADNNTFHGMQLLAYDTSGSSGYGRCVQMTQWPGSPAFPLENRFDNMTLDARGLGGVSGTGGNTFSPFPTSDGAPLFTDLNIFYDSHTGHAARRDYAIVGSTSGKVTIQGAAAAGSWSWTVPATAGTAGQLLKTDGAGVSSWTSALLSSSASAGVGYTTGAGGAVTQATSKSTTVTLNTLTGVITMNGAALAAATTVLFILANSQIGAADTVIVSIAGGASLNSYTVQTNRVAAGQVGIEVRNYTAGTLSDTIVLNFAVVKGSAS